MYYYIYDTYLNERKYQKTLDQIKARLLDLEIKGRHEKLTLLKNLDELIADEVKKGVTTVVFIGNEKSFLKVVNAAAHNNVTLGLIPIGPGNNLAQYLGIPEGELACDILAARKVVKFDLGKVKDHYFFSNLKVSKNLTRISIEKDNYKMIPTPECSEVIVNNFYYPKEYQEFDKQFYKFSAQDGKLELVIKKGEKVKKWFSKKSSDLTIDTIIQGDFFEVRSFEYLPVLLDGYKVLKTPVKVEVHRKKLNVIVGKDRHKSIK